MSTSKPKGLGRGLSALMANIEPNVAKSEDSAPASPMSEVYIPIEKIQPNPDQPRRSFTSADLDDLANSIRAKGVIQPLIVRRHPTNAGEYQIVFGDDNVGAKLTAGNIVTVTYLVMLLQTPNM